MSREKKKRKTFETHQTGPFFSETSFFRGDGTGRDDGGIQKMEKREKSLRDAEETSVISLTSL